MTSSAPSTSVNPEQAPISVLIQYIPISANYFAKTARSLFRFASWLLRRTLSYPSTIILSPLAILFSISLYILAPVTVFMQVLLDVFVLMPYNMVIYLVDAMYPVYVFCGVACITGVIVGVLARQLVFWLVELGRNDKVGRLPEERPTEVVAEKVEWDEA
ncbi:hypothetical protein DFH05DRAFT_1386468 [Lentinula detonsa]|uniref:Uncharacterized protein n=1 Tax=Lentinula detonsa TaxID=2804962 RepID=A0A9W8PCH5_9AGAR|nr:hypothetical protein DFH05DRAFT_1386468 [Lentinula detonsa]